jgi:hypothetical protein
MADKEGWRSKGDKVFRRSPRQQGKTCGRPFTAPRKARETTTKTPKVVERNETEDSEIRVLSNSEVQMIVSMQNIFPEVLVEMTTENKRQDAEDGGSDSDEDIPISTILRQEQDVHERPEETEVHSNTTESTPEIFKSPVREVTVRHEIRHVAKSPSPVIPFVYEGPNFIAETEQQDIPDSSDSDDNVPDSSDSDSDSDDHKAGWLRDDLVAAGKLVDSKAAIHAKI